MNGRQRVPHRRCTAPPMRHPRQPPIPALGNPANPGRTAAGVGRLATPA
jgi:hypothetical protein